MVRYPVIFEPDDNGTVLVTFPDFPEAATFGDDEDDALGHAHDALATIVDEYIRARRSLPRPSEHTGKCAELSALMSAKVEIYNAMQTLNVSKADLGRRLSWHQPQVDRLLDLNHGSQVDQLDAAAKALGGRLRVQIEGILPKPRTMLRPSPYQIAASVVPRTSRSKSQSKPAQKVRRRPIKKR